jgi:hypothetical protein
MKMETSDLTSQITTASFTTIGKDGYKNEVEHFFEMIDLLSGGIYSLKDELIRLSDSSLQQSESLETTDKVLSMIKTSVEESNNVLSAINTNLLIVQQELSSLKLKFEEQQIASYDGTFVWKISQFQEKMSKDIS